MSNDKQSFFVKTIKGLIFLNAKDTTKTMSENHEISAPLLSIGLLERLW
jgi:hypothetical protein